MKQRRPELKKTDGATPPIWKKLLEALVVRPTKALVITVATAIVASLVAVWAPRILNTAVPGRPVVDVEVLGAPPPVDTAHAEEGTNPPIAYNAHAFPELLTSPDIQELNTIVARQDRGITGPGQEALTWMRDHNAYDVGGLVTRIVVQAIDQPVRVVSVRALVQERNPPLAKTVLYTPPEGGDEVVVAALNLDTTNPSAPYFSTRTESMNPGESVVIDVEASVSKYSVVWQIGIDIVAAGRRQTVLINHEDGEPFRTTGLPNGIPKESGTRHEFLRQYPDPWWFRFPVSDTENPIYQQGLPSL